MNTDFSIEAETGFNDSDCVYGFTEGAPATKFKLNFSFSCRSGVRTENLLLRKESFCSTALGTF